MDRSSILRWVVIAAGIIVFWKFGLPLINGTSDKPQSVPEETYVSAPGFVPDAVDPPVVPGTENAPTEGEICKIQGDRFDVLLSSRGAAITHLNLLHAQYSGTEGGDLSTTPDHERWRSLRTSFRGPEANDQLAFDRFLYKLEPAEGTGSCTFTYEDATVRIKKVVARGTRPYELTVATTLENLADAPKRHQLDISTHAYRLNKDVKGSLGRVSPLMTELSCASGKEVIRKNKDDFKSGWFALPSADRYAAVNTQFFSQALLPAGVEGGASDPPRCELLAEQWVSAGQSADSDDAATVYHARLVYPVKELPPKASITYRQVAFFGPKERELLAVAGGGSAELGDVINLGFFSPVARVLVGALSFFHDKVTFGNWGLAIIVMTLCLRTIMFPLTWKSIRTTIAMRKLKPEVDALNAKFKDDAQAKNLAMMELWKKHGVNPFGGCLPQLVQMPVWFAMYTTLQTAVAMYHTKFLWFADLSSPDAYYVLPILLGGFMILQQRIVPQQGMDPMQQKMMMYMLPAVFTVMMLFLPAALGVYMLTNSILGIGQQLAVERFAPRAGGGDKKGISVKQVDPKKDQSFGKGKARV